MNAVPRAAHVNAFGTMIGTVPGVFADASAVVLCPR